MSYDTIKNDYNAEIMEIIYVTPHKCKFTTQEYVDYGAVTLTGNIDIASGAGVEINFTGGDATKFTATSYFAVNSEIIRVSIETSPALKMEIVARAQFGTVAAAHASGASAQIKHSGEVDNTCHGYPETCSDPNSYAKGYSQDLIFPSQTITNDTQMWSGFKSVKFADTEIDPGETMGKRGKVTCQILDSVDDSGSWDIYTVPYADRRTKLGTRFRKTIARTKYLENRPLVVYTGFKTSPIDLNNFTKRQYIIDDAQIDKNDIVTLKALDPLILCEDKKAKAPTESQGSLATAIISSSTTITVKNCPDFYYGTIGTNALIRFGSETIMCQVTGALTLSITTRGFKQPASAIEDHDIDETAQLCISYENIHAIDIIVDLIANYTKTPIEFIDNYTNIKALIPTVICTAYLTKPKAVKDLINELIKVADLSLWFEQSTGKIAMNVVPEYKAEPIEFNESSNIEIDSFDFKRNLKVQYTRAPVYWAPVNIAEGSSEKNFAIGINTINLATELESGLGSTNEKKPFYCNWLQNELNQNQIGSSISNRLISRANNPPIDVKFNADISDIGVRSDGETVRLGSILNVSTREVLNVDGSPSSNVYQVLSLNQIDSTKHQVKARLWQLPVNDSDFDFTITESKEDYDLSTEFAPASAGTYSIYISPSVVIGQVNAPFAMTLGAQAAGVEFNIVHRGQILARGANGAAAADVFIVKDGTHVIDGETGGIGGGALNITAPTTIDAGSGFIFAGGGSSGSGGLLVSKWGRSLAINGGVGSSAGRGYLPQQGSLGTLVETSASTSARGISGGDSTLASPGFASGSSGGEYGETGDDGPTVTFISTVISGGKGGLPGYAITSNGHSVIITSGDTALNIKGRRQ